MSCRVVVMAFLVPWLALAQSDATTQPQADGPPIAIKTTKSGHVAYREHRGPYWTIGPQFAQLHRYLDEQDLPGPMYARFLNEMGTVPMDGLRVEIGFFLTDTFQRHASFQLAVRRPDLVAYMLFEEPSANRSHDLARLRDWVEESGYKASGPVTEIYHVHTRDDDREIWRTEVQLPIAPLRSAREVAAGEPPSKIEKPVGRQTALKSNRPNAKRPMPTPPNRFAGPAATGRASTSSSESRSPPEAPREAPPLSGVAPEKERSAPVPSAHEFIESGRFDELAQALMPVKAGFPPGDGVWRGQVALRVVAVARGILQMYPTNADWPDMLADALTDRFAVFVENLPVDPREQAIVTYEAQPQLVVARKQAIMRKLDRLLGNVASRVLDADAARMTLADILQQVFDVDTADVMASEERRIAPTP